MNEHLIAYQDGLIAMKVPAYLRRTKDRLFKADGRRNKHPDINHLFVDLFVDSESAEVYRSSFRSTKEYDWMGVKVQTVLSGPTHYLADGLELLTKTTNAINKDANYQYHALFILKEKQIYVTILGNGDLENFYALCKTIVSSICWI